MSPFSPASEEMPLYRGYLRFLAMLHLDPRLQGRVDPATLAESTLREAIAANERIFDEDEVDFLRTLRTLLARRLAQLIRDELRQRFDPRRQRMIEDQLQASALRLEYVFGDCASQLAARVPPGRRSLLAVSAIDSLTKDQRETLLARRFRQRSVEEIAQSTQRSEPAVNALLQRGEQAIARRLARQHSK